MKNKRFTAVLMAGMITAAAFAGCGDSGSSGDTAGGESTAVSSSAAADTGDSGTGGSASGEEETAEPAEIVEKSIAGNYISVLAEMWGISLTGEELEGFSIDLEDGGSGTMVVDGESGSLTWTDDGEMLIIEIEGEEILGNIGEDTLVFEDMLGMGLDITFAKEGTAAADPENYLPDEDKAMLGVWNSYAVADVMGDDASEEVDPAGLTIEFFGDRTATASLSGTDLGTTSWSSDFKYFDNDYLLVNWETIEDSDDIIITYSDEDNYWDFTLSKAD